MYAKCHVTFIIHLNRLSGFPNVTTEWQRLSQMSDGDFVLWTVAGVQTMETLYLALGMSYIPGTVRLIEGSVLRKVCTVFQVCASTRTQLTGLNEAGRTLVDLGWGTFANL